MVLGAYILEWDVSCGSKP